MSKIIAGDLVIVTGKHCADGRSIGKIFTVTRIMVSTGTCTACGGKVHNVMAAVDDTQKSFGRQKFWAMPLPYLTKIEPLPASERREQEMMA